MPLSRSEIMSRIRGKRTKPELALFAAAGAAGLWFRRWCRAHPGTPDLCLHRERVAVFASSCFWHRCPRHYRPPRMNAAWWDAKTLANARRDRRAARRLRAAGFRALTWMGHESLGRFMRRLSRAVRAGGARGAAGAGGARTT